MATRSVRRLGLEEETVSRLTSASLNNCADVFSRTDLQLVTELNINLPAVEKLQDAIAAVVVRPPRTAAQLYEDRKCEPSFIASGLPTLDMAMQGGFPTGMITELVGAAGVGKTQLCLSLAAQCCLPQHYGGLGATAGAVVIDTERKFSAQRLQEVAKNRVPTYYDPDVADHGHENLIRLLENTTVIQVDHAQQLLQTLQELQPLIIQGNKKLIILDSVAALARKDFAEDESLVRQESLVQQAALLKRLADVYGAVVLVTNQVTTRFGRDLYQVDIDGGGGGGDDAALMPALGNTWHHCVSNRLVLRAVPVADSDAGGGNSAQPRGPPDGVPPGGGGGGGVTRSIAISKSPLAPRVGCAYAVRAGGVIEEEVEDDALTPPVPEA